MQKHISPVYTTGIMLAALLSQLAFSPVPLTAQPRSQGFELAWAVMIGLLASLVLTGVMWARAWRSDFARPLHIPAWLDVLTPALTIIGLGIAGYLTYVETQAVAPVCGPVGDCESVQLSSYAMLFGVLPIGLLGMIGYAAILVAWLWGRFRSDRLADYAPLAIQGMTVFGVLFSVYLTYLELFVIQAVCMWCLAQAVTMTLLLLLTIPPALASLGPESAEDEPAG